MCSSDLVQYEHETEKVGGLFNKEIQETGNVVISQEDFDTFQKQIEAAQMITEDYEHIKSGKALNELKNQNKKLRQENNKFAEGYKELRDICDKQREYLKYANSLIEAIKEIFRRWEEVLGREKYLKGMNALTQDNTQRKNGFMAIDRQIHPEKYEEKKKEQKRDRGRGR